MERGIQAAMAGMLVLGSCAAPIHFDSEPTPAIVQAKELQAAVGRAPADVSENVGVPPLGPVARPFPNRAPGGPSESRGPGLEPWTEGPSYDQRLQKRRFEAARRRIPPTDYDVPPVPHIPRGVLPLE
jgi:hypothetical protein